MVPPNHDWMLTPQVRLAERAPCPGRSFCTARTEARRFGAGIGNLPLPRLRRLYHRLVGRPHSLAAVPGRACPACEAARLADGVVDGEGTGGAGIASAVAAIDHQVAGGGEEELLLPGVRGEALGFQD